jgi:hypothetical protein
MTITTFIGVVYLNCVTQLDDSLVYQENHRPAASLTDFIRNGVSSNKGVLIADIYIRTTVYINLKNIPRGNPGV